MGILYVNISCRITQGKNTEFFLKSLDILSAKSYNQKCIKDVLDVK